MAELLDHSEMRTLATCPVTTIDTSTWTRHEVAFTPLTILLPSGTTEVSSRTAGPVTAQYYRLPASAPGFYEQTLVLRTRPMSTLLPPPDMYLVPSTAEARLDCTITGGVLDARISVYRRFETWANDVVGAPGRAWMAYRGIAHAKVRDDLQLVVLLEDADPANPERTIAIIRSAA